MAPNGLIVGVGASQQDAPAGLGVDAISLMIDAADSAGADSGNANILRRVESVFVTQGTWVNTADAAAIASSIGAPNARTSLVELGIPQQALIDLALGAIARGEIDVALVLGGEAKSRDDKARRAGLSLPQTTRPVGMSVEVLSPDTEIVADIEINAGFVVPVQQYAAIDNALRFAEGVSIAEHFHQIDALWSRFDSVASSNPEALYAAGRSAQQLREVSSTNRAIAFPYNKHHATQWSVDQAGALLLCSEAVADELRIERERRIYPLVSLESSHSVSLSKRSDLHRWQAMGVLRFAAEKHLAIELRELDFAELYSCFPAAVRVQQRELGLDLASTPTLTGGMPFAGGPFNNFVFNATARMVKELRTNPGTKGLVTTVSGLLTKPGLAVYSTERGRKPCLLADLKDESAQATPTRPTQANYRGRAKVATYTVRPSLGTETEILVVADTPEGTRIVATIADDTVAKHACHEEFIGTEISVKGLVATV